MKVLKFGGTSVGTVESLANVKKIVDSLDEPAIVVVSALGGLTDRLISTAHLAAEGDQGFREEMAGFAERHHHIIRSLVPEERQEVVLQKVDTLLKELENVYTGLSLIHDLPEKTLDLVVSFGERMSSIIVAEILNNAEHADSLDYMKTERWFNRNIADRQLTESLIRDRFKMPLKKTVVAGGFISRDKDSGQITNLGRGGSDYTAALIAAALDATLLEIWTDVDGFMTADPRIISDARIIDNMSFIESMELCSFGAKVIYPPTIYPVFHKNIPIKILNTHNPIAPGTLITDNTNNLDLHVRGVSAVKKSAILTISGHLAENVAEINSRTYNAMARNAITVYLVAQPNNEVAFSLALSESEANRALTILREEFAPEMSTGEIDNISLSSDMAIIAVVRESIKKIHGLGARLVNTLQRDGIKVHAVSDGPSETTIAIVVANDDTDRSLRLIHNACFS